MVPLRQTGWIVKWCGSMLSLFIVLAWVFSLFWMADYTRRGGYVAGRHYRFCTTINLSLAGGCLSFYRDLTPENVSDTQGYWSIRRRPTGQQGWKPEVHRAFFGTSVTLPLWILLLLIAVPTAVLFWRDRRYPRHCCQKCGYDLTGNLSGLCPECGEKTTAPSTPRP